MNLHHVLGFPQLLGKLHNMTITIEKYAINISDDLLRNVSLFKQTKNENESGGVLFCKKKVGLDEYYIIDMTLPNKHDKSSRFSFVRNAKEAQKIIEKKWKDSDGYINYIGEWHTHPETSPSPSFVDIKTYKQISKDKSSLFPISINIIFGNANLLYICGYRDGKIIFEERVNYEQILY